MHVLILYLWTKRANTQILLYFYNRVTPTYDKKYEQCDILDKLFY
jgi:hypothetical protein